WALYQMSEYVNMMTMSAFISTLFLGGWRGPAFLNDIIPGMAEWPFVWLIAKMAIFMFLFILASATLPRFRYDQLMRPGCIWLLLRLLADIAIFLFLLLWARATLPRFRYDQLMRLVWIWLFEFALLAALLTGAVIAFVL